MSTPKKIIIALIIILALAVVAYFLFLKPKPATEPQDITSPTEESKKSNQQSQPEAGRPLAETIQPASAEEVEYGQVRNLTLSFSERFGSYSNQAEYQNLLELKLQMTENLKNWTDNFIAQSRQSASIEDEYYSQTTKALSIKENYYDVASGQAEFIVTCQRQETTGSAASRAYYQKIKITLKKQTGAWLVDTAEWQ